MVLETITPDRARELLALNKVNRRFRMGWAKALKLRMDRGEWKLTHQGIAIGGDGVLKDGQHRLHAVLLHGQPVQMAVFYDTPADTFGSLDQGLRRSVEDQLGTRKEVTQPASFLARLTYGSQTSINQISVVHKVLSYAANRIVETTGTKRRGVTSAPVRAAAALQICSGVDADYVCRIYRMVANFETANPEMPPIAHSFLRQVSGVISRTNKDVSKDIDLFVRALVVFDPARASASTMQVKDHAAYIAEARREVLRLVCNDDACADVQRRPPSPA